MRTSALAMTFTYTYTCTHSHVYTHLRTPIHADKHAHTRTHTHTDKTLSHTRTNIEGQTHTHTHTSALAMTLTRTSPALGGSTVTSSHTSGCLGAWATIAFIEILKSQLCNQSSFVINLYKKLKSEPTFEDLYFGGSVEGKFSKVSSVVIYILNWRVC